MKEQILRREFAPNEKLSIPLLAEQLGVSRTPIRDALNRLEMEGLVKTVSKVGTFVSAIDEKAILDIMDTRLMLECWVIDRLPSLPDADLEAAVIRMTNILDQTAAAIRQSSFDSNRHADSNLEFHLAFIRLGRNQKNSDIYTELMNYRFLAAKNALISREMVESALDQHLAIVEAIRHRRYEALRQAISVHLEDSKLRLLEKIRRGGGAI
ncbi:MAG: GntR family transcriptional regulator [Paenibacillus sp.]|nr:GntR family transcriptional regulator [Paenibacillus sp.]